MADHEQLEILLEWRCAASRRSSLPILRAPPGIRECDDITRYWMLKLLSCSAVLGKHACQMNEEQILAYFQGRFSMHIHANPEINNEGHFEGSLRDVCLFETHNRDL